MDTKTLVHEKISKQACLLDSLLLSTLPNGDPAPDETINEEITLLCFTVSCLFYYLYINNDNFTLNHYYSRGDYVFGFSSSRFH